MLYDFLCRHLRHRVIAATCPEGLIPVPLLTRWRIVRTPRIAVFLHLFHRSDMDEWHDHPWSFITLLLSSGYWENQPDGRHWRKQFSLMYRPAEHQHFVEVVKPTWTLVIRLRRRREWGFITKAGWVLWSKFVTHQHGVCNEP